MAYYSRLVRGIYHECRNCEVGNNIEEHNLLRGKPKPVKGRNGKIKNPRLCKVCEDLRNEVRCVPGVPPPTIVVKKPKATSYTQRNAPKFTTSARIAISETTLRLKI